MKKSANIIQILLAMFAVLLIMLAIVVVTFDLPDNKTATELIGTVDGLYQGQGDMPRATVFLVKLEDGTIVRVKGTSHLLFKKGKKIKISEQKTSILKRKIYHFVSYVEENQGALLDDVR